MRGRSWLVAALLGGTLVGGVLLAGPPAQSPSDPLLAARRLLREVGVSVRTAASPASPPSTFVVAPRVRVEDPDVLLDFAAEGGRLVVADPDFASDLVDGVEVASASGGTQLNARCAAPEAVADDAPLTVSGGDAALSSDDPQATSCYPTGRGSFLVVVPLGAGEVVLLGGTSPIENSLLLEGSNAAFAIALLGSRGAVVFAEAGPPPGSGGMLGVWRLLPSPAKAILIGVGVAGVAFALHRGRRLGPPVTEEALSPIPSGELVRATARLYRSAGATAHCGNLSRRGVAGRLAPRLGLPPATSPLELARLVASTAAGGRPDDADVLAGRDPSSDEELIALGRRLEELRRRMEVTTR